MRHLHDLKPSFVNISAFYINRQFAKYILFGGLSTVAQLGSRYILSSYFSFSLAVFIAYFISMATALFLYRSFVFDARAGSLSRQVLLFALGYLAFLPVTWGLSVAAEGPLLSLFAPNVAGLMAHLIGVSVPVVLNFAFNKLVTFRTSPALGDPAP